MLLNYMQGHGPACKLMDLHASSWICMQAHVMPWNLREQTYTVLYKLVQPCTNLYRLAQCCTDSYNVLQTCTILYRLVQCCTDLLQCRISTWNSDTHTHTQSCVFAAKNETFKKIVRSTMPLCCDNNEF